MSEILSSACIGLGSNLGDSLYILRGAWQRLGEQEDINLQALSSPYRTKPVGMNSEHWFINAAGLLTTTLSPESLLNQLLAIEHEFGRRRNPEVQGHQDRTLDLDLLLYDDCILETSRLRIPHPEMHARLFVLAPLTELVPNQLHPQLHCSLETLCQQFLRKYGSNGITQTRWPGR
jgi:2-amino-4-hydroxy-6-hydroxymethyldihydropteridine diphosphokinase